MTKVYDFNYFNNNSGHNKTTKIVILIIIIKLTPVRHAVVGGDSALGTPNHPKPIT